MIESRRPEHPGRRRAAVVVRLAGMLALAAACGDGTGTPDNPTPVIQNLDPASVPQYSDTTVITLTGTGFVQNAVVRVDGTPRLTEFVSASQVRFVMPPGAFQQAGTLQVTAFNPAPGGGASASSPLTVPHRVPWLTMAQPADALQGDTARHVLLLGSGFAQGSVARWNGADRVTTFRNPGELLIRVTAADLAAAGTAQITVFNPAPGGGVSSPSPFHVQVRPNPVPVAGTLTPDSLLAETDGSFVLTGSGFMAGSVVSIGGVTPPRTLVSDTEMRFSLTSLNVPNAGFAQVIVTNPYPGGGTSNPLSLKVYNPPPVLTALTPAEAIVGADSVVLRLTGSGFVRNSEAQVGSYWRASRRVSPTEMEVLLGPYDLSGYDSLPVRVVNAAPGGGVSAVLKLPVVNARPVATAVHPAQAVAGADSLVIRVTGSAFGRNSVIHVQGRARPTRFVAATELEAVLITEDLADAGTAVITVTTPAPGGGTTSPLTLEVVVAAPTLTDLPSYGASAGRPGFQLMVHGTGFLRSSEVRWNGQARATNFISSTRLEANISSADLAAPGTGSVTVHTPGGGTSAARQVTVRAVGPASITASSSVALEAQDIVYDPHSDRIYAAVGVAAGSNENSVVAIDPSTGDITASVVLGGNPTKLAVSDDGTALWVALEGTGQVRRLSLPALVPGTVFSLGEHRASDMEVMPGRPGTVAISLRNQYSSPSHAGVYIYDNGVRRPQGTPGHTGANQIVFGESAAVMYGMGTESGSGFYTLRVSAEGVEMVRGSGVDRMGWTMEYGGGRVYTSLGGVVDGARHELVGDVAPQAQGYALAVDVATGRAFYARQNYYEETRIRVFDLNTFQVLGEVNPEMAHIGRLVRWGTDGLAASDGSRILIFRMPLAGP